MKIKLLLEIEFDLLPTSDTVQDVLNTIERCGDVKKAVLVNVPSTIDLLREAY